MAIMFIAWLLLKRTTVLTSETSQSRTDPASDASQLLSENDMIGVTTRSRLSDFVNINNVDLYRDEYSEVGGDIEVEDTVSKRMNGKMGPLWRLYYWLI